MVDRNTRINQTGTGVMAKQVDMAYDAASQMTTLTRFLGSSQGVKSSYTYLKDGLLAGLKHTKGTTPETTLASYALTYELNSHRIAQIDSLKDGVSSYTYNKSDELLSANYGDGGQANELYKYDVRGDRIDLSFGTPGFAYGFFKLTRMGQEQDRQLRNAMFTMKRILRWCSMAIR